MEHIINFFGRKRFNVFDLIMILIGLYIFMAYTFWQWVGYTIVASIFQMILDYYYDEMELQKEFDDEELEKEWLDSLG